MIDPLLGKTLGQYELQDRLGQGGMATVYRGLQPALGRSVAVKVLRLGGIPDETLPARFRREARLAANLLHPNIVPVYDFGEWDGYLCIVMALLTGGTLKDRMQGPLSIEAVVRLVGQVADALAYAHGQGVFHRDVKPANVLLAAGDWAMLADFGIARALGESTRLTGPNGTIGTPAYMAPEQWMGGDIDGRADIYSLGVVLYELLAGTLPFAAATSEGMMRQHLEVPVPPLASRMLHLPDGFEAVVQTALAKDPAQRYRHAGEFRAALESAASRGGMSPFASGTSFAPISAGPATTPHLGSTMRVPSFAPAPTPALDDHRQRTTGSLTVLAVVAALLAGLLIGALVYILTISRQGAVAGTSVAPSATNSPATVEPITPVQAAARPTEPPIPTRPVSQPPTVGVPTNQPAALVPPTPIPPTRLPPTLAPPPTVAEKPTIAAAAPPTRIPQPPTAPAPDQPRAQVERRVSDYFAALNAGDFARAQAACCTPAWRSRFPLDEWRKNFAGVTDLRFATPFRYTTVEPQRIIAEVDYSFANSSGTRRFFALRWTFVPVGADWLADEATAAAQR